jgi:hypothetical protein
LISGCRFIRVRVGPKAPWHFQRESKHAARDPT